GALILIYAPENTTIKLNVSINDIVRVKIIDLETRHAERGRVYLVDDVCCIEMHTFSQDALYVVEMKK
ncbi:beta-glucosidase, partial [Listeria monocytogenes]|nr:beta-glucosidase [Listeria monocytogenes]